MIFLADIMSLEKQGGRKSSVSSLQLAVEVRSQEAELIFCLVIY